MKIQMHDGQIKEIEKNTKEAFEILNHSTSHLLAEALLELYPQVKFGIGPAIEEGFYYDIDLDQSLLEEDLITIEAKMHELAAKNEKIVREVVSKEEAKKIFANNPYKIELINELNEDITIFKQGNFIDLCYGPHLLYTGNIKHFKLLSIAGAYWRGDSKNKMLTRIYGTSWFSKDELEKHLNNLLERKKRDHRLLGKQLNLFMLSEYGPGFPFYLPDGVTLKNNILDYWKEMHYKYNYQFCETPTMLSRELWEISGHWEHYRNNMYTLKIDDRDFAVKPMNCPGGILVYKNTLHSYRDLPIRLAELGHVHRHEASGALNGLLRVRAFSQDDAHIFCREDQLVDEISTLLKFYDEMYSVFGLSYHIELSTRPEKDYIGDIALWDKAESILKEACLSSKREFIINPGDGAFYGPKLDFKLCDSMGRIWQCGTIQLDMNLPERFDMFYIDENGNKVRPIMLHRACLGSIERFMAIIIENYGGAFPLWLAPTQIVILPVNENIHLEYALEIQELLKQHHLRVKVDASNEKLGYRLRNAQVNKYPLSIVLGDKEKENGTVTYREYGSNKQVTVSKEEFIEMILDRIAKKI